MRAAKIDRVKRRVLQEAVADNIETIRGLPPRGARSGRSRSWVRRASLFLIPVTLAGSSYVIATNDSTPRPLAAAVAAPVVEAPAVPVAKSTSSVPTERMAASAFPLEVRRVILDAGHGGSDPGAIAGDLLEKEITLDIAGRLAALLSSEGFEVVITRTEDTTVALRERAQLANGSRGDIFVSIHVNALVKHTTARGIETYYLGPTTDPSLTALAAAENRVSGYSVADMRRLLDNVYADARAEESRQLAAALQNQLFVNLRASDPLLENWGVKRAPFLVLVATDMPAVLAEVGCISNEQEAEMLRQPAHRQRIANALFAGIRSYAGGTSPQKKGIERNG